VILTVPERHSPFQLAEEHAYHGASNASAGAPSPASLSEIKTARLLDSPYAHHTPLRLPLSEVPVLYTLPPQSTCLSIDHLLHPVPPTFHLLQPLSRISCLYSRAPLNSPAAVRRSARTRIMMWNHTSASPARTAMSVAMRTRERWILITILQFSTHVLCSIESW
jgi:hypothetical protein